MLAGPYGDAGGSQGQGPPPYTVGQALGYPPGLPPMQP
jgi:hypothetical protein